MVEESVSVDVPKERLSVEKVTLSPEPAEDAEDAAEEAKEGEGEVVAEAAGSDEASSEGGEGDTSAPKAE